YLPDDIYTLQHLFGLYIPTAKLRQTYDYLDGFSRYGFLSLTSLSFKGNKNIIELDFLMKPEYFPALNSLNLSATNIVSIPESLSRFTSLAILDIQHCKQLWEIPRLPQSVECVNASKSYSLNPQSLSTLLNQVGEILGILPNKACKGARSRILMDPQTSSSELLNDDKFDIILPVTEIPSWLNLNHESDRDVLSFWVGRKFPNPFYVCFAFGPANYSRLSSCEVFLSINGCEKKYLRTTPIDTDELSDDLWIFSLSNYELQIRLNESNPSELNYVESASVVPKNLMFFTCRVQVLGIIVVALIWINGLSTMEEILDIHVDGEEETIDQPMPDVAKNTTCPTSDGFESDSDSGKGALVQPFQLQRACPGVVDDPYGGFSLQRTNLFKRRKKVEPYLTHLFTFYTESRFLR
ncbi:hypothetical protein CFP56_007109, partial [Quercus suber]